MGKSDPFELIAPEELLALRKDRERLEWIAQKGYYISIGGYSSCVMSNGRVISRGFTWREAIDNAMKEGGK